MNGVLLRDVEVDGVRADVRVRGDRITAVEPGLDRGDEEVIDGHGGALIPGLCDHHLHLHALAADARSARCGPPTVHDAAALAAALVAASGDEHGWVRGTGYVETVAGDLDATRLDRLHAVRPVRVQHRSGALWMLNSAAVAQLGLADAQHAGIERDGRGAPTGRVWRADAWLRDRLPRSAPPSLAAVGARLAALGITAVVDATPDLDPTAIDGIRDAVRSGTIPQRVHLLGVPLGTRVEGPRISTGPFKIVLADSHLPDLASLSERVRAARAARRAVAAHCLTREALLLLLAALDEAGGGRPEDRIEHAALVPAETIDELARRGITVVTQPGFLTDRGDDYLRDLPAADQPDLYRCASLREAGVPLAFSSDAPYGPLDPWTAIAAATTRHTRSGAVVTANERIGPREALNAYLSPPERPAGKPRRVEPGARADLVLLDHPLTTVLCHLSGNAVRAVLSSGRIVHQR